MKIYTKTGDTGTTSLFSGKRLPKHHIRIDCIGNVDELNAHLGMLQDMAQDQLPHQYPWLADIQSQLFIMGANLASTEHNPKIPSLTEEMVLHLERTIDEMDKTLPKMTHFILPVGNMLVSQTHICRAVCRRAERSITLLASQEESLQPVLAVYLNRLSDLFFVLARHIGWHLGVPEKKWEP